jgi:hypothetical protein
VNVLLVLLNAFIKDVVSKYAESHGILSDKKDGFRLLRNMQDALVSLIMMVEDAKSATMISTLCTHTPKVHSTLPTTASFKHMRHLDTPPSFFGTYDQI